MVSPAKQTQNRGLRDDNELVEFPDSQYLDFLHQEYGRKFTGDTDAIAALHLPALYSPLEKPPLIKKQGSHLL